MEKYVKLAREGNGNQQQDCKGKGRDQSPGRTTFAQKGYPVAFNIGGEPLPSHCPNPIPNDNFHRGQTPKRGGQRKMEMDFQGPKGAVGTGESKVAHGKYGN